MRFNPHHVPVTLRWHYENLKCVQGFLGVNNSRKLGITPETISGLPRYKPVPLKTCDRCENLGDYDWPVCRSDFRLVIQVDFYQWHLLRVFMGNSSIFDMCTHNLASTFGAYLSISLYICKVLAIVIYSYKHTQEYFLSESLSDLHYAWKTPMLELAIFFQFEIVKD